jgi:hypothetical protein
MEIISQKKLKKKIKKRGKEFVLTAYNKLNLFLIIQTAMSLFDQNSSFFNR